MSLMAEYTNVAVTAVVVVVVVQCMIDYKRQMVKWHRMGLLYCVYIVGFRPYKL
jgi:hypothetical protein